MNKSDVIEKLYEIMSPDKEYYIIEHRQTKEIVLKEAD